MALLKRLHVLTLRTFIPPFFITLFVSVFLFFLVQIVITYLDDMIGKGLRTIDLAKLFTYAWITIIPQCIPLAVLLASIMCYGNLAENYELAAMKSSGLSLFRIIRPVFAFIVLLAALTFLFNNFILPVVHLKSTSLLYDIRQKKPAVNIKEGIFYNGIDNYSLRVGRKSENKDTLYDILIYDHTAHQGNVVQMYAKSGKIMVAADTSELMQVLWSGNQYEELIDRQDPSKRSLVQTSFRKLVVHMPLEDFKLRRTNEELFKGNEDMMNVWQLDSVIDSSRRVLRRRVENISVQSRNHFFARTSAFLKSAHSGTPQPVRPFVAGLSADKRRAVSENAMNIARTAIANVESFVIQSENDEAMMVKYEMEWHKKIVISFACIVLFFVGAPLGAIIRKGGLGLPVIVSVFFFLAYYILTEMYMQLALDRAMPAWEAMWMPLVIFLPISIFLTAKAANDSVIFDATAYYSWAEKIFRKKKVA
jgi:lipopolysaccharide export system permease protein